MDKNAIKKYAVWARNELIARVSQKAQQYGITAEGYGDKNADSVNGVLLSVTEKKQRQALITKIDAEGFEQVMEEVAYTWFNRFTALRFMEVNNYLPSHTRVFTNEANEFKPQILADAISLELEGLDIEKVFELKSANKEEDLYKYLLIVQCNALSGVLPGMFQKIADYTELLLPDYLLREDSVIEQMIRMIPENDWLDQVQIIGWLYQAYYSEPKDERINAHKKYKKNDIPFVTQLFTPDWIVKYMVENSLGRLWNENHSDDELKAKWEYFLQSKENQAEGGKSGNIIEPEKIRVIDPCSGSGHVLTYMFDVLMQIYDSYGYSARDAVQCIIENNIYGLDIDERAAQMAYFSVMMKGRQYDARFFRRGIQTNVFAIQESNDVDSFAIDYFCGDSIELRKAMNVILHEMKNAREYGSLITTSNQNWEQLYKRFDEIEEDISIYKESAMELKKLVQVAEVLSKNYDAVVTNPPYMGASLMPNSLKEYIGSKYADYKSDIFAAFIVRCIEMSTVNGQIGLLTPYVWMFLSAHEKLRTYVNANTSISSLIQLEYNAFEAACVPVATFTLKKSNKHTAGEYIKLSEFRGAENQAPKTLEAIANPDCGYRYTSSQDDFIDIPGSPIAYWISRNGFENFKNGISVNDISDFTGSQHKTADNEKYLRLFWEVAASKINNREWIFYNKGGDFRRWYGNNSLIVDWSSEAIEFYKNNPTSNMIKEKYWYQEGITYTSLTSSVNGFRYLPPIGVFDIKGPSLIDVKHLYYCLAFFNSKVADMYLKLLNPTVTLQVKDVKNTPLIVDEEKLPVIEALAIENVNAAKVDWDSFETSWDFSMHPFLRMCEQIRGELNSNDVLISECFEQWAQECEKRFCIVKNNEEEINRLFIDIYHLNGEIDASVNDQDVSINRADKNRDVRSFISYAVGCMFGRYSLDASGLLYAGGKWEQCARKFIPDEDGIIPICDDEYFDDDIVALFVNFVKVAFGESTLEENLLFVAKAIGGKGNSRAIIRSYFINEFYNDHCSTYSITGSGKRPIYWLFDSGKKNGFKCLIYMHRYQPDTIARIRTDYVHEQQSRYRTALADLEQRINGASTSERVKLNKQLKTIQDQAEELRKYEEKIHHLADQMISIDLDDGVKENYAKFQDVLAKIK